MQERYAGLMDYLAEAIEECREYKVVARKEPGEQSNRDSESTDLLVLDVIGDDSDAEICILCSSPWEQTDRRLTFGGFYESLVLHAEKYPEYSWRVSEYFEIDDEHIGRADMPLRGAEVDHDQRAVRLFF
jgi:hypothetical protein